MPFKSSLKFVSYRIVLASHGQGAEDEVVATASSSRRCYSCHGV